MFIISRGMLFVFIITLVGSGFTYKVLAESYENWFVAQIELYETK